MNPIEPKARSLVATKAGIETAENAMTYKSWSVQALANQVEVPGQKTISQQTVRKFLNGGRVDRVLFSGICHALGLDWKEIAGKKAPELSPSPTYSNLRSEYNERLSAASERVWICQTWLPSIGRDSEDICRGNAADIRLLLSSFKAGSAIYSRIQGRNISAARAKNSSASSIEAFAKQGKLDAIRFNYGHHPGWIAVLDKTVFWGPTPVDRDSHAEKFLFHKHTADSEEGRFWISQFETMWDKHSHSIEEEKQYNEELLDLSQPTGNRA